MEAHSSDTEICGLGCEVLAKALMFAGNYNHNSAFNTDKIKHNMVLFKEEYRTQVGREGVIELVTATMKGNIKNAGVCKHGCRALYVITENNSKQNTTSHTSFLIFVKTIR